MDRERSQAADAAMRFASGFIWGNAVAVLAATACISCSESRGEELPGAQRSDLRGSQGGEAGGTGEVLVQDAQARNRIVRRSWQEVAQELGSFEVAAATEFSVGNEVPWIGQKNSYGLKVDEQGDFLASLDSGRQAMSVQTMGNDAYVRFGWGKLRKKRRYEANAEWLPPLVVGTVVDAVELFGSALTYEYGGREAIDGVDAIKLNLGLTAPRPGTLAPSPATTPLEGEGKEGRKTGAGADERAGRGGKARARGLAKARAGELDESDELEEEEQEQLSVSREVATIAAASWMGSLQPVEVNGAIWIDGAREVVLRAEIVGRLQAAVETLGGPRSVSLTLRYRVSNVGAVAALEQPRDSVEEDLREAHDVDRLAFFRNQIVDADEPR